jgi:hypothetical protein
MIHHVTSAKPRGVGSPLPPWFDKNTIGATESFSRPLFDSSSADKQFDIRPDIIPALAASSRNNSSSDFDRSRHQPAQNRLPFSERSPFCKLSIIVRGAGPYTIDGCLDPPAQFNAVRANVIFFLPLRRVVWSTVAVNASSSRRQSEFCFRSWT